MLKAFIERKKAEFSVGTVLGSKTIASNLKKNKLKSKDALQKKSNEMSQLKPVYSDDDD